MALVLRAFDFAHGLMSGRRDFHCGERADETNSIGLNFVGKRDLARQNRFDLRGFKFKDEKFHKAAERGKI